MLKLGGTFYSLPYWQKVNETELAFHQHQHWKLGTELPLKITRCVCFYPWHTGLEISPFWVVQLPRNSRKLQLLHWPENGFNLYCFILPVGNYPLFSSTPARKKRKNSANPTLFCTKPSLQLDHSPPWGMLAFSIKGMDCFPSSGFIVTHPHRAFYRQIDGCLIKGSYWKLLLVSSAGTSSWCWGCRCLDATERAVSWGDKELVKGVVHMPGQSLVIKVSARRKLTFWMQRRKEEAAVQVTRQTVQEWLSQQRLQSPGWFGLAQQASDSY